jgi:hypothetical protein
MTMARKKMAQVCRSAALVLACGWCLGSAPAQDATQPPAGQQAVLTVKGDGVQIAAVEGGVADVAAGDEVDHVLGDVGGVIADALEIFGHEDQLEGRKTTDEFSIM